MVDASSIPVARRPDPNLDEFLLDSNLPKRSRMHGGANSYEVNGGVVLEVVRRGVVGRASHSSDINSVSGRETKKEISDRSKLGKRLVRAVSIAADQNRKMRGSSKIAFVVLDGSFSRYLRYGKDAVLVIGHADDLAQAVVHESTHAVLDSYGRAEATGGGAGKSASASLDRIAGLFLRLSRTKPIPGTSRAVGLAMVDPSWWKKGAPAEHPWDNYDEFFASAYASYANNRRLFTAGVRRAERVDPAIQSHSSELFRLLWAYHSKGHIRSSEPRSTKASQHRSSVQAAPQVIDPAVISLLKFKR